MDTEEVALLQKICLSGRAWRLY